MTRFFGWVAVVLLLTAAGGTGAPVTGARIMPKEIIGGQSKMEFEEKFLGGRRACVIAVGDHRPPVNVGIAVYDEANRLVAEDQGGGEYVAAIWYPPRDAQYKIVVKNSGVDYNAMYLVFK